MTNEKARELMYEWHGGQFSTMYAAASSGLVENLQALISECQEEPRLLVWLGTLDLKCVIVNGSQYLALPWAKVSCA